MFVQSKIDRLLLIQLTVCAFLRTVQGKGFELETPEKLWEIGGSEWCALCLILHVRKVLSVQRTTLSSTHSLFCSLERAVHCT